MRSTNWRGRSRPKAPTWLLRWAKLAVEPNAVNAVPGSVRMILETRSTDERTLAQFEQELWKQVEGELHDRRLLLEVAPLSQTSPTACSPLIQEMVAKAATAAGFRCTRLASGAGHDGVFVAPIAPMGMIFVPCRDGRSHAPEEWAEPSDCANGARVLAETLILLDGSLP